MMKSLWMFIENKKWRTETKYKMAFVILGILFALAGMTVWLLIRTWAFSTPDWMLCFIGYPVILSWLTAFLYSCRHCFHNGTFPS